MIREVVAMFDATCTCDFGAMGAKVDDDQDNVTKLLERWQGGESEALDKLMPLVYAELRRLGRTHMRRRGGVAVIQPTVLVHEAWLRLVQKDKPEVAGRRQFYALAAKIMRDVLVDSFRRQHASKRSGSRIVCSLDDTDEPHVAPQLDLLVLDDALQKLARIKSRYTDIVDLRYFGGLSIVETAEALQISHATVEREWNFARAWLRRELGTASR